MQDCSEGIHYYGGHLCGQLATGHALCIGCYDVLLYNTFNTLHTDYNVLLYNTVQGIHTGCWYTQLFINHCI